jgi:hypothetical protein
MNPSSSVEIEPGGDPDVALIATGPETAAALAAAAGRKAKATPIRRVLVQPHERAAQSHGGPLAQLVRRRDRRALVLYLMIVTMASKEPWDVTRDAQIWARFLSYQDPTRGQ